MFAALIAVLPRLLTFRAGPQDLPYATQLTPWLVAFAVFSTVMVLGQVMPAVLVVLIALLALGALGLATHAFLRARNFANRFNQTFNALLLSGGVLMLLVAPLFSSAVPALKTIAANPELLQNPEHLAGLRPPMVVGLLLDVLFFWNLAVMAHVYRQAGELRFGGGLLMTLAVMVFMFFTVTFGLALFGGLFGVAPQ